MALDDKSEIISHFIGLFDLKTEAARLRADYEEFKALKNHDPDLGGLLNVTVNLVSDYGLGSFIPEIKAPLFFPAIPGLEGLGLISLPAPIHTFFWGTIPSGPDSLPFYWSPPVSLGELEFFIPPPASVATITAQYNFLSDNDFMLGFDFGQVFLDPLSFNGTLTELAGRATALQPIATPDLPEDEVAIADSGRAVAEEIRAYRDGKETPTDEDATVFVAFDEDAVGVIIGGERAEEMPDPADYSDAFVKEEEDDEVEGEEEEVVIPPFPGEEAEAPRDAPDDSPPVHEVVAGENLMLNQTNIVMNWLDAKVFVVMGDVVVANSVSQINAWNDVDTVNGAAKGGGASTTQSVNASAMTWEANPFVPEEGATGPAFVAVTTITGNVINYNHVQQYNFATDHDVVSVSFSASETFIQTGDNTMYNIADILEWGYAYDLIVIGGNMIDVALVSQINVLLDADNVTVAGDFSGLGETSGNLLFNYAEINQVGIDTPMEITAAYGEAAKAVMDGGKPDGAILDDPAFLGTPVLKVLYISGDYLDLQVVDQVNVLGDVDQVALAAQTAQSLEGANVELFTGGNELINIAAITDLGMDSTIYTAGGAYSDAMLYQAELISNDDPIAQGMEALASEAVLFLADGMLGPTQDDTTQGIAQPLPEETPVDVMQTLVA